MAWTLADITSRIQGRILYFGDPSRTWSLAQFDAAFAQVKTWGFDGVAPKLSDGQGTDYATDADLRAIIAKAKAHGLTCWPWVGVSKGTPQRWADICSEMAHATGLAFIDVEAPADFHPFMAEYRAKTPENFPVLCTCGGNPVTWSTGWPGPTAVQEGVVFSGQWYYASWKGGYCSGLAPDQCINKADAEWIRVAGPSVILVPLNFDGLSAAEVTALATCRALEVARPVVALRGDDQRLRRRHQGGPCGISGLVGPRPVRRCQGPAGPDPDPAGGRARPPATDRRAGPGHRKVTLRAIRIE